ncbi:MAG: carbamoyltransferase, partial [Candidatus Aenigmatarchaeota archaeon]
GETESLSVWYGCGNKVKLLEKIPISASLGLLYEAANLFVGLRKEDSGKTMGLAAYGKDKYDIINNFKLTNSDFRVSNEKIPEIESNNGQIAERKVLDGWIEIFEDITKTNSNKEYYYEFSKEKQKFIRKVEFEEVYKNLAASVQSTVEKLVLKVVKKWLGKIDTDNVCLAGGVALNCKLNGKILEKEHVNKLFIQPASHDAGTALGAAIYLSPIKEIEFDNVFLGPSFDNEYIKEILDKKKISFRRVDDIPRTTAKLLEQGKIIGWFQGRMEFGPRALGNRSILADPRKSEIKDKVNEFIKEREKWRPFAPSIKEEKVDKYLKNSNHSPYMILSFDVISNKRGYLKAVTHVDGTTRPQTVRKSVNNKYWRLIDEFEKLTGVPAVLNTSFNKRGEPIVCTPNQALKDFYTSGLDYLVLGDFIVEK